MKGTLLLWKAIVITTALLSFASIGACLDDGNGVAAIWALNTLIWTAIADNMSREAFR